MLFKSFVKLVVDDFIKNQTTFSVHDVTKEVRSRVNADPNAITDKQLADVPSGQTIIKTILVDHNEVRDIIYSFLPEIDMLGYVREHNGSYWEFKPANTTVPTPTIANSGAYNGVSSFAPTTPTVTPVTPTVDQIHGISNVPPVNVLPKLGSVTVNSYTRKNGKFVASYTRSFPSRD